jgi:hypothetical protein
MVEVVLAYRCGVGSPGFAPGSLLAFRGRTTSTNTTYSHALSLSILDVVAIKKIAGTLASLRLLVGGTVRG